MADTVGGIFAGVDAGVTPVRALTAEDGGRTLGVGVGRTAAEAVSAALSDASQTGDVAAVAIALPTLDDRARQAASSLFPHAPVVAASRAACALYGASGTGVGVWLDTDAASAFARGPEGAEGSAGGWGPVAGDEGSPRWLGLEGIRAVFRAHDGRTGPTALTALALQRYAVPSVEALRARLDEGPGVDAFAADVAAAAAADKLAASLANHAALHLANLARAAAHRAFGLNAADSVSIYGCGYAFEDEAILGQLSGWLEQLLPGAEVREALASPTAGALLVACQAGGVAAQDMDWPALLAADARLISIASPTKGTLT